MKYVLVIASCLIAVSIFLVNTLFLFIYIYIYFLENF